MKRALRPTGKFLSAVRRKGKDGPAVRKAIEETLAQMEEDLYAPSLKAHKLKGPLKGKSAVTVGYDLRIVYELVSPAGVEEILLLDLGTHEEVYP